MDVLLFLKTDHETIRAGLDKLAAADGVKSRRSILDEVAQQLQVHLTLERDYLYPEITDLFLGADTVVDVGLANAALISKRLKTLVKLAAKTAAEQEGFDKRVAELREAVAKHFEHEEQNLLPKMRYLIRTEDREDLGQVFLDVRAEVIASLGEPASAASPAGGAGRRRA